MAPGPILFSLLDQFSAPKPVTRAIVAFFVSTRHGFMDAPDSQRLCGVGSGKGNAELVRGHSPVSPVELHSFPCQRFNHSNICVTK